MNVHLGFEVGTGKHISVPLAHTFVTGQTQLSGKTTTLQALVSRSGKRALAFVTKRGESLAGRPIRPFLPRNVGQPIHWRVVETILAAALGQRAMKYERYWLIEAAKGATDLEGVRHNVVRLLGKARGGRAEEAYTLIREYLDLVVPDMCELSASDVLDLQPGLNVMDVSASGAQLQAFVIRASLERINRKEHGVVVVLPEAWEFAPRDRSAPAKDEAIAMARKGAVLENWLLVDSQDISGVDTDVRKQCSVWLLGVQRELNEVKRTLDMMPGGIRKPKADDVTGLELGEFFACWGRHAVKVYVQPSWMSADDARAIALGELDREVAAVKAPRPRPSTFPIVLEPKTAVDPDLVAEVERFTARGQRAQKAVDAITEHFAVYGPGLTFGELKVGERYWDARPIVRMPGAMWPPPRGPLLVKTSARDYRFENGRGVGTAEDYYRVERWVEEEEFMSAAAEKKLDALSGDVQKLTGSVGELVKLLRAKGATVTGDVRVEMPPAAGGTGKERRATGDGPVPRVRDVVTGPESEMPVEDFYQWLKARLIEELPKDPRVMEIVVSQPELRVKVKRHVVVADGDSIQGLCGRLIVEGFFDEPRSPGNVQSELRGRGHGAPAPNVQKVLEELARWGFLTIRVGQGKGAKTWFQAIESAKRYVVEEGAAAS